MRVLLMLGLLMFVGCAAHRTRGDCEGHLKSINAPAHVTKQNATPESGATR